MRLPRGRWWILLALALPTLAACMQETSYPLDLGPPRDAGVGWGIGQGGFPASTSSTGTGKPGDAGTDACAPTNVCTPVVDAGPDASCPPSGTVTGSLVDEAGTCSVDFVSLGGAPTSLGCCASACVPPGCKL